LVIGHLNIGHFLLMYLTHWHLSARPFENATDARFYYPGESQQAALLKLRYAVENRQAAAVLAGASGLGKTLLAQTLLRQVGEKYAPHARIVFPHMPADQLLALIADQLTGERWDGVPAIRDSVARIDAFLRENAQAGRHAVVVVDEAHLLRESETLQTLRLLLNFEADAQAPLTLILVGQSSLLPVIERMPDFDQRLAARCLLRRFAPEETAGYVQHRLRVAGATTDIFDSAALEAIHQHSQGIPRKINRLCDLALLVGFAEERRTLQAEQISAVAEELVATVAG
jgi:general secretion pathway protein A